MSSSRSRDAAAHGILGLIGEFSMSENVYLTVLCFPQRRTSFPGCAMLCSTF